MRGREAKRRPIYLPRSTFLCSALFGGYVAVTVQCLTYDHEIMGSNDGRLSEER